MRRVVALAVVLLVVGLVATASLGPAALVGDRPSADGGGDSGATSGAPSPTPGEPSPSASDAPAPLAPAPRVDSDQKIQKRLGRLTARKVEELAQQMREPQETTLLQLNMCMSGVASCYGRSGPGARIGEAVAAIRTTEADVVVVNEACSRDAGQIAAQTGLELTFSVVPMGNRQVACRRPGGRGSFGNAVLSRSPVGVQERAYGAQADAEQRRALCVVLDGLTVCGTHLSAVGGDRSARRANDRQCGELSALVATAATLQPVVASGDVNRRPSCAPSGFTTLTDAGATQARGIQHTYVDGRLTVEDAATLRMRTTDHDALVVRFVAPPLLQFP